MIKRAGGGFDTDFAGSGMGDRTVVEFEDVDSAVFGDDPCSHCVGHIWFLESVWVTRNLDFIIFYVHHLRCRDGYGAGICNQLPAP